MKLVRYGRAGAEKPGLIDDDGAVRDLSRVVKDITPDVLSAAGLKRLRGVNVKRLPVVRGQPSRRSSSRRTARSTGPPIRSCAPAGPRSSTMRWSWPP